MAFKDPKEVAEVGVEKGVAKSKLSWDKALVAGFLAGAYIAFGALLATVTTAGLTPERWGTLPTFFAGAVFSLGLILVVIGGSELLTGNMALVPLAAFKQRVPVRKLFENFGVVLVGNLLGSLFVAYFLADQTGLLADAMPLERIEKIAMGKGVEETEWEIFLRAMGCNWLVCLAVFLALAAEDVAGKILAIFFPIMAFVAMGFDHVVANMFFLPAAIFAGVDLTWWDAVHNWIFAFLGNLAGAVIFVAGSYWYLYASGGAKEEPTADATQAPA
jgi:formate transporter